MISRASLSCILACIVMSGCASAPDATKDDSRSTSQALESNLYGVVLQGCEEALGGGLGLTAAIRARVPSKYSLAGDPASPVTVLVIRTVHCLASAVNGVDSGETELAQIGPQIASPDGTGDVNSYQLWYYTTNKALAKAMNRSGIPAQYLPQLSYDHPLCGPLVECPYTVDSSSDSRPRFNVTGTVTEGPAAITFPFHVNWWRETDAGSAKMSSSGPGGFVTVNFGSANLTATTPAGSELAEVYGTTNITFPIFQQFNTAPTNIITATLQ
jgi:hypothetical protein